MHASRAGNGRRAFVGLHGWAGNRRTFRRLEPSVPDDASLFSFDLPGYGESPAPREWSLSAVADAVAAEVAEVPFDRMTLLGYCGGAIFALTTAQRMPDRVERIVLLDPFAYVPPYFRIFTWGDFGRYAYLTTFANPFGRWLTNQGLRSKRGRDGDLSAAFRKVDHEVALAYLRVWNEVNGFDHFRDVATPIEMIYGERSFRAVAESVEAWSRVWPSAKVTRLADTGHEPLSEATARVAELLFRVEAPEAVASA